MSNSSALAFAVRKILTAACLSSAVWGSASAQVQSAPSEPNAAALEEITVTAQRREERLVDVPISITSLSGESLQAAGVTASVMLPQTVPGLRFDLSGAYVQPTIRGVGSALAGPGMNSNVAIYIDGFYLSNLLATDFDLASIESVNVLKGPQGTLFGRNATGGAILVTTRDPSHDFGGEVKLAYGSFDRTKFSGYLTGGLTDSLAADMTVYYEQGDGYIEDKFTGKKVASFDRLTVRSKLLWELSDTTKFVLTLEHRDSDDPTANFASAYEGLSYGSIVPGTVIAQGTDFSGDQAGGHRFKGDSVTLRADFDLGFANLTSYTMYRDEEGHETKDYDSTLLPVFAADWRVEDETVSQEFNLSSKPGEDLSWVLGLFYYQNENKYPFFKIGNPPSFSLFTSDIKQTSLAAFADATYEVTDKLFLTAGLRASQDKSDASQIDFANPAATRSAEDDWSAVTPRLVARYELSASSNLWASYSQGYKSGLIPIQETTVSVDPEQIDAFEIGYKTSTGALRFDASAFYYDYQDLQIASYIGQTSLTRNAAKSTIYGVDLAIDGNVTDRLYLRAAATWTDAKYDEFPGAVDYVQVTDPTSPAYGIFVNPSVDATDNDMSRSPAFTGSFGASYSYPVSWGQLGFDANLYMTSKFYFDPVNRFSQDAYQLLNLRATWTSISGAMSVGLYGNNVTDEDYRAEVLPGPFAIQQIYGEPAAYGVEFGFKF